MRLVVQLVAAAVTLGIAATTWAQNLTSITLGGAQFWTDHFVYGQWRIQQHVLTGHCRLLDDANVRQTWGTYADCRRRFDELKAERDLPRLTETAVITIHGLGRTRRAMQGLADYLADEGGWTSINVSYASTRSSVADHAQALQHVVENLEGVKQVHLVGHSLGNIVIRRYLADRRKQSAADRSLPRVGRIVMLAPPNSGSSLARILKQNQLFEWLAGSSGQELGTTNDQLQEHLATPGQFGIVAGSTRDGQGTNPLVPGDDDMIVGVDETKLAGATDFLVVESSHTYIMNKDEVMRATLRFLQHGHFVSAEQRRPIAGGPSE